MSQRALGFRFAAAIAIGLWLPPLQAQTERVNLIDGMGNSSCVQFIELNAKNEQFTKLVFGNWSQGFFSGINVERSITKRKRPYPVPASANEAANKLLERCRKDPAAGVFDVQIDLLNEFDAGAK